MDSLLAQFVNQFPTLSEEDIKSLLAELDVQTFQKGTVLIREGEISTKCYFLLKGCVRQYYLIDGEEKTTAFYTEEQAVVSLLSYTDQVPATHYFVCMEDCTAIVGDLAAEQEMYEKMPQLQHITRKMMEQDFGKIQADFAAFMTSSPEERYQNLLNTRPGLIQRVPQHQLASYLGVTPESLSRIKKRILKNTKSI